MNLAGTVSGVFADKNVGAAKVVTVSGSSLTGLDALNYTLAAPAGLTANITPASLAVVANNATRNYGDVNPVFTANISGFATGENLATSGVTGTGGAFTVANQTSNVGNYGITMSQGTLAANNYVFTLTSGALTVTPRPLFATADNVVRFDGEANPAVFAFSTNVGGLVNGDILGQLTVTVPPQSVAAVGGDVFALVPGNAIFSAGLASNYSINYVNGLLLVLPRPLSTSVAVDQAAFLLVDPQQEKKTALDLQQQQSTLVSELGGKATGTSVGTGTPNSGSGSPATGNVVLPLVPGEEIKLVTLREQPLLSFAELLQVEKQ